MEKTPARFIWHYVKIFKWSFLLIGFLVIVRQITEAIGPWYLAKIYETVSAASESGIPWQRLYIYAFWLAAVYQLIQLKTTVLTNRLLTM